MIKIADQFLELDENTTISATINNPAFDAESIGRVFSYPIKVPFSPGNKSTLDHDGRIDSHTIKEGYDAKLYIEDIMFDDGIANIDRSTEKDVSIQFQNRPINIYKSLEAIKINTILPTIVIPRANYAVWILGISILPEDGHYFIKINDSLFTLPDGAWSGYEEIMQWFVNAINTYYPGMASHEVDSEYITLQTLSSYRYWIFLDIYSGFYFYTQYTVGQARQQDFIDYMTDVLNDHPDSHSFPVLKNDVLIDPLKNKKHKKYVNYAKQIDGTWHFILNSFYDNKEFEHSAIPFVKLPFLLQAIADHSDLIDGFIFEDADFEKFLIYNNRSVDELLLDYVDNGFNQQDPKYINCYAEEFSLNNHVPDLTAKDFITKFAYTYNLQLVLDGKHIVFKRKVDQLRLPPIEWTKYVQPYFDYEKKIAQGYRLYWLKEDKDTAIDPTQLLAYSSGKAVKQLESQSGTIFDTTLLDIINSGTWKVAYALHPGSTPYIQDYYSNDDFVLRFFFDHNFQLDSDGNTYWLGSHSNRNYQNTILAVFNNEWSGEDGLYATFWSTYAELISDAPILKLPIRLRIAQLLESRTWVNSKRRIVLSEGAAIIYIRSIQIKSSIRGGLGEATVEFYKQP